MPTWKMAKLGDVCSFEKEQDTYEGLPYVGLENIESGTGRLLGATSAVTVKSATFRFSPVHVLYGRLRPYLNKVLLPEFEGHCSTEIFPIRPGAEILREYLFHWLSMEATVKSINATSTGARMPRANMNAVLNFKIPVPPLTEQRRIVAIVNEAFEGIATARANAENCHRSANELLETYLGQTFSQEGQIVQLSNCATDISDGDHAPPPKSTTGVPFITISNLEKESRRIDFSGSFAVPRDYYEALKPHRKPRRGDVLYTVTGSFGIPVLVDQDVEFCFQRHIGLIRPKPDVDSRWLTYALLSPQVRAQAEAGATGAAQRTVSLGLLRGMTIPKVELEQQRKIAANVEAFARKVARLKDIACERQASLDELKQSLLHQAFAGRLTTKSTCKKMEAVA